MSIFLIIDDFTFYIDDNYFYDEQKNLICRYSSNLSSSYEIKENIKSKYRHSIYASDYFKIYSDFFLSKYEMINIIFRHSLSMNKNISFSCGKAGLLYNSEKQDSDSNFNFIYQIHSGFKNIDYSFMFKFNEDKIQKKNEGGLLIIGAESYIKNNKNYEIFSIYTKNKNSMLRQEWRFDADNIIIGNKLIESNEKEFIIKTEFEFIEISYNIYQIIDDYFFSKYYKNNICVKEEIYNYYIIIYCFNTNFTTNDIINFPKIEFTIKEINFNFSFCGEELFYKTENKYFLKLITRIEANKNEIKLGRMFLRKYNVIFNSDSKMMSFYKSRENVKQTTNNIDNNQQKNRFLIILRYIFFCILFLIIGFYCGRKYCIIRRKRFANELEDNNYIYEPEKKIKN